jgi:WD40 repeat protein
MLSLLTLTFPALACCVPSVDHRPAFSASHQTTYQAKTLSGAAFSNDAKWLATAGGEMGKCGEVALWDLATHKQRQSFPGHSDLALAVALSPDGKTLASAGWDQTVKLWNTVTGKEIATLRGHGKQVWCVAFSPTGKLLASGSADQTVKLWDVATGQERATLRGGAGASVVFSPDGRTLAVGTDDATVTLWDVTSCKEKATLMGHTNWIADLVFAPDGKTLVSASWDTTIILWDVDRGRLRTVLAGHKGSLTSVVYSPDGRMLASACQYLQVFREGSGGAGISKVVRGSEVKLWEVASCRERLTFEPDKVRSGYPSFLAFTGDSKHLLAVSSPDGTVTQWALAHLAATSRSLTAGQK